MKMLWVYFIHQSKRFKIWTIVIVLTITCLCGSTASAIISPRSTPTATFTAAKNILDVPMSEPEITDTNCPTDTLVPTFTILPTNTLASTFTILPTNTLIPTLKPTLTEVLATLTQTAEVTFTPLPTKKYTVAPPPTAANTRPPTIAPTSGTACCKHCGSNSQPCGDSCISLKYTCSKPPGCACK